MNNLEQKQKYLILGLGNPGRQYEKNRHNIGFMVVNHLAQKLGITFTRMESRALVTKGDYDAFQLVLAKPQTFMNLSGTSMVGLLNFYKIPTSQSLVILDDIDLPVGRIRLRPSGGSGGHKGLRSIIERLGTQDIPRLRIGVGRPPGSKQAANYVLQEFSNSEIDELNFILEQSCNAILLLVSQGIEQAMNQFNPKDTETEIS